MKTLTLNGQWQLTYFPTGSRTVKCPTDLAICEADTIPADVPGNVELDLMAADLIPDPYFADQVLALRSFETYEWWYKRVFTPPFFTENQRILLAFHGLDCLATIWINRIQIGKTDNMFIEHRFDVTQLLIPNKGNELVIRLYPPVLAARQHQVEACELGMPTNWESISIRKAPHMFGWDIAPRIVSAGIWRSVQLEIHEATELQDLYYYTSEVSDSYAVLEIRWQFITDENLLDGFRLRFTGSCNDSHFVHEAPVFNSTSGATIIRIPNPYLWWPRGYGEANLYEVTCALLRYDTLLDERTNIVGLRKVELVRTETTSRQKPGDFLFKCNGEPILVKGSNWVPADAIHSRDANRYQAVLEMFIDLECNAVRCWGGNVYEDHRFFDICDRSGIMVWQDFAMACTLYPQTDGFQQVIKTEAEAVVRKLRNHPSLVVWVGDNEVDECYRFAQLDPNMNHITRQVLPRVLFRLDPHRPYVPSSPYMSSEVIKQDNPDLMPERHLWGARSYYKSSFYTESSAHLVSEIGYHGCPNVSSISKFIRPSKLWPYTDNPEWIIHASDPVPSGHAYKYRIELMANQIQEFFGQIPDNLEEFALASQISQAEALKFFIEMTRLGKWRKTGILWWNMIDCWPQFSDAVVDYYFGRKLAYWYIKRVQQPVCVMLTEPEDWHCTVVIGNDSRNSAQGTYQVTDAQGTGILSGTYQTKANTNKILGRIRVSHGRPKLFLIRWQLDGHSYGNHYLLGTPPFHLEDYREYLEEIAHLPLGFDPNQVAK